MSVQAQAPSVHEPWQPPLTKMLPSLTSSKVQVHLQLTPLDLSQTESAIIVKLNQGTVCHVVHGRRFPDVPPMRPPWM